MAGVTNGARSSVLTPVGMQVRGGGYLNPEKSDENAEYKRRSPRLTVSGYIAFPGCEHSHGLTGIILLLR
jgi:hypothetical protein